MEVSHSNTVWLGYIQQLYAKYRIGVVNMGEYLWRGVERGGGLREGGGGWREGGVWREGHPMTPGS